MNRTACDLIKEEIKCPVCLDLKSDSRLISNCYHSVCIDCLKHWSSSNCPVCRAENIISMDSIEKLPKDYLKNNLIEKMDAIESSVTKNELCLSQLTQFEEVCQCGKGKKLECFCKKCDAFSCFKCLLDSESCREHHIFWVEAAEKNKSLVAEISAHKAKFSLLQGNLENLKSQLITSLENKKKEKDDLRNEIQQDLRTLEKRIKDEYHTMQLKIDEAREDENELTRFIENIDKKIKRVESLDSKYSRLLQQKPTERYSEFIKIKDAVQQEISALQNLNYEEKIETVLVYSRQEISENDSIIGCLDKSPKQSIKSKYDKLSVKCNQLEVELKNTRDEKENLQKSFDQQNKELIELQVELKSLKAKVKTLYIESNTSEKEDMTVQTNSDNHEDNANEDETLPYPQPNSSAPPSLRNGTEFVTVEVRPQPENINQNSNNSLSHASSTEIIIDSADDYQASESDLHTNGSSSDD